MRHRRAFRGTRTLVAGLVSTVAACAGLPQPPASAPHPESPNLNRMGVVEPLDSELQAPRALPPRVTYHPATPEEGTLLTLLVEPHPRGLPALEVNASARGRPLALAPIGQGTLLGVVAVPLAADRIDLALEVTYVDGTRLRVERAVPVTARDFPSTRLTVARRYTAPAPSVLERITREREMVRGTLRRITPVPLWEGPFVHPRPGTTTSPFGQLRVFNGEVRSRHTGLDIRADEGTPVYASNSGRVAIARDLYFTGNTVYLDHGLGLYTGYFHLSSVDVTEGIWVEKGELIGRVGATGRVTGPHLHWALSLGGTPLDPASVLQPVFAALSERIQARPIRTDLAAQP